VITVERTDFISVPVTDLARSIEFYEGTLGLPRVAGNESWPEFQLGENVSLYLTDPTSIGREFIGPHTAFVALRVADVAEARAALEARGVAFEGETFDTGVCHMALFHDPDGNSLMLHRRYAPREN
jgi:catechol 2,3-dioxygenase-like lactoylglutathione lyase family enzyme